MLPSFYHHPRTVISWPSWYWYIHILLLDLLQPMKVSGQVKPTATPATHHLTLVVSHSELVRKLQVDQQYWVGQKKYREYSTRKTPGGRVARFPSLLPNSLLLLPRNRLPRWWLNKKTTKKISLLLARLIRTSNSNLPARFPSQLLQSYLGAAFMAPSPGPRPTYRKSGGRSHISGIFRAQRVMARTFLEPGTPPT